MVRAGPGEGLGDAAEVGGGRDFDVVGIVGCGLCGDTRARGRQEVETDAVACKLATDAVEFGAIAEGDVLGGIDGQAGGSDDCQRRQGPSQARA